MPEKQNEYNALRAEILAWIQVEYTLIGLSAVTVATALTFYKDHGKLNWTHFSAFLLFIVAALDGLISFARSKIMIASTYIMVFLKSETEWEGRWHKIVTDKIRPAFSWRHESAFFLFQCLIGLSAVYFPWAVSDVEAPTTGGLCLLVAAIAAFVYAVIDNIFSYSRLSYMEFWEDYERKYESGPAT